MASKATNSTVSATAASSTSTARPTSTLGSESRVADPFAELPVIKDVVCRVCSHQAHPPARNAVSEGFSNPKRCSGLIAFLPAKRDVPADSIAHRQHATNEGAFYHSGVVAHVSECRHMVFCLPTTTFGGRTVLEKYPNISAGHRLLEEYLAFDNRNGSTLDHNDEPLVDYVGVAMEKQAYLHLDFGYWIEWHYLKSCRVTRRVTEPAMDRIKVLYAKLESTRMLGLRPQTGLDRAIAASKAQAETLRLPQPTTTSTNDAPEWRRSASPTKTIPITAPPSPESAKPLRGYHSSSRSAAKEQKMQGHWRSPTASTPALSWRPCVTATVTVSTKRKSGDWLPIEKWTSKRSCSGQMAVGAQA